jgi:hypothetical protein
MLIVPWLANPIFYEKTINKEIHACSSLYSFISHNHF